MQERDVAKFWQKNRIHLALIGVEHQVSFFRAMPLRIIGYDGAAYRDQLNKLKPEDETAEKILSQLYPAITLVLYFNYERRWAGPLTLKECLKNIPPALDKYVSDYRINVFDIAWLPDEQIAMFKSDYRFVADYKQTLGALAP